MAESGDAGPVPAAAIATAKQQLKDAQDELAAARPSLAAMPQNGNKAILAVARGRVAGAAYPVSSAEMNLTAATAGIAYGDLATAP